MRGGTALPRDPYITPFVAARGEDGDGLVPVVRDGLWLGLATGLAGAAAVGAVPFVGALAGVPRETPAALGVFPYLPAAAVLVGAVGTSATSTPVGSAGPVR